MKPRYPDLSRPLFRAVIIAVMDFIVLLTVVAMTVG